MKPIIQPEHISDYVKDGSTLYISAFGLAGMAEETAVAIRNSFDKKGSPRDLTIYASAAAGNFKDRGAHFYATEGLLKRYVTGHFGGVGPALQSLIVENKIEAYNLPQGVLALLPRNIAGRRPGFITKVGLNTFVDPRIEGGKSNAVTTEDIVEVIELKGEEWLYYHLPKVDVAIIRGSVADENGNITIEKDGIMVETLSIAEAAKASGGIVIAEVEKVAKAGTLNPKQVKVPGIMVDYLLISTPEHHFQTMGTYYNNVFNGEIRVPVDSIPPMPMSDRKIICRRAAMELAPNSVVNLGVGIPDGVASVANEEGVSHMFQMSTEGGGIGGVPAPGLDFGNTINADAIIEQSFQFDFYDGGGIDITFLGLAEVDPDGNLNVSKFNNKPVGCGGFINITQNAKKVVFCGTFTAGGLETAIEDGKLKIIKEGRNQKFVKAIEQITFSAQYAKSIHQPVLFITERAVFELTEEGLVLTEIADGIDLDRDVLSQMAFKPIINDLKKMPAELFQPKWGKLAGYIEK